MSERETIVENGSGLPGMEAEGVPERGGVETPEAPATAEAGGTPEPATGEGVPPAGASVPGEVVSAAAPEAEAAVAEPEASRAADAREGEAEAEAPATESAAVEEVQPEAAPVDAAGPVEAATADVAAEAPAAGPVGGPVAAGRPEAGSATAEGGAEAAAGAAPIANLDELVAIAERWATVEEDGTVKLREGAAAGRVVGKVHWHDRKEALARLVLAFQELEAQAEAVEREVGAASNKASFQGRVRRLVERVNGAKALGDFDALMPRLQTLEAEIGAQVAERTRRKEDIVARAEALSGSSEWRATGEALEALLTEWKGVGGVGEAEEALWARFKAARDAFRHRRSEHFAQRDQQRAAARAKKEELIARAEELCTSTDWKATAPVLQGLQAEWKQAGSAGPADEGLWTRFRAAMDTFFGARAAFYAENRRQKEELIARAEELSAAGDFEANVEEMKGLQGRWREVGFAGPDADQALWHRFRAAQDAFFARRKTVVVERERVSREGFKKRDELVQRAEALTYSADVDAARREVESLRAEWNALGLGGGGRGPGGDAERRFRRACETVLARARESQEGREVEWVVKTRLALERKRADADDLRAALAREEAALAQLEQGGDADGALPAVRERVAAARAQVEEMDASIKEVEALLEW